MIYSRKKKLLEKQWAEINADVLRVIAKKVGDIVDIIRLRVVCKNWRSAVHPSDVPPQLPWFVSFDPGTGNPPRFVKAFSICSNKTYNLPYPVNLLNNSISSSGYLYNPGDSSSGKFFNPLTGVEVPFPSPWTNSISRSSSSVLTDVTSTSKPCLGKQCEDMMFHKRGMNPDLSYSGTGTSLWRYCKQTLIRIYEVCCGVSKHVDVIDNTPNPELNKQLDVMFTKRVMNDDIHSSRFNTSLWRYCEQKWTRIFKVRCSFMVWSYSYCNGKFYAVNWTDPTKTNVVDVSTSEIVSVIQNPPEVYFRYLIDACGDLLGVHCDHGINDHLEFQIYRLDNATENPCWIHLNRGIGDRILFLNQANIAGFCLEASDYVGLKGNCIYYIDYGTESSDWTKLKRCDLSQCKTKILRRFPSRCSFSWLVPSLC